MSSQKKEVRYLPNSQVVVVSYNDLVSGEDLSASIEAAFGFGGLGLITVSDVPNMKTLRGRLLPLAKRYADLPEEIKNKTTHPESFYSFGWSHGKEMMAEGKPDFSKGSYYGNPLHNKPIEDEELIRKYPSFCHPNIWPTEDLPELEGAFMDMGKLVVDVGLLLAKQCDDMVRGSNPAYQSGKLHNIIHKSRTHKARLLHYFPIDHQQPQDQSSSSSSVTKESSEGTSADANQPNDSLMEFSSWCGWHNDHGSLTGLVPAMYITKEGEEVSNPDPQSGLYIRSRNGTCVKAAFPADHLAFQIGETATIHSGGILQATPHCVRGASGPAAAGVSRETFAVFMEPMWDESMILPEGSSAEQVTRGSASKYLPPGVPLLATRWKPEQDFGQFTEITLKSYY